MWSMDILQAHWELVESSSKLRSRIFIEHVDLCTWCRRAFKRLQFHRPEGRNLSSGSLLGLSSLLWCLHLSMTQRCCSLTNFVPETSSFKTHCIHPPPSPRDHLFQNPSTVQSWAKCPCLTFGCVAVIWLISLLSILRFDGERWIS